MGFFSTQLGANKGIKNKPRTGLPVDSSYEAKCVCQSCNTLSLKVTWRKMTINIKNLS